MPPAPPPAPPAAPPAAPPPVPMRPDILLWTRSCGSVAQKGQRGTLGASKGDGSRLHQRSGSRVHDVLLRAAVGGLAAGGTKQLLGLGKGHADDLRLRVAPCGLGRSALASGEHLHGLHGGGHAHRLGAERARLALAVGPVVSILRGRLVDRLLSGRRVRAELRLGEREGVGKTVRRRVGGGERGGKGGGLSKAAAMIGWDRRQGAVARTHRESFESSSSSSSACLRAFLMTALSSTGKGGQQR